MSGVMRQEVCKNCGKTFETDKNAQKHCSVACRREYNGKKRVAGLQTIACAYCGEDFNTLRKRSYCSKECRNIANGRYISSGGKPRKPKKPVLSLSAVERLAREVGLTYGEYVRKYDC